MLNFFKKRVSGKQKIKREEKRSLDEEVECHCSQSTVIDEEYHHKIEYAENQIGHYQGKRRDNVVSEKYGKYGHSTIAIKGEITNLRAHLQVEQKKG